MAYEIKTADRIAAMTGGVFELSIAATGNTLAEGLYSILETDAQSTDAGCLGASDLLNKSGAEPYGVYFRNPPADVEPPLLTYFMNVETGRWPRISYWNLTAWGDNYEAILERCYALLHELQLSDLDGYTNLMIKWDYGGPELWSDEQRVYFQQHRYIIKGLKT